MAQNIQSCFRRYEKKYFLTPAQQKTFIKEVKTYTVADEHPDYTICNIYYDTDTWEIIRASLEKPDYKEKLRVRTYGTPKSDSKGFVEIKKKCDGIVYKRRIVTDYYKIVPFLNGNCRENYGQIGDEIRWFQQIHHTRPKVFIAYDRMAFAGKDDDELRITFDRNMRFRTYDLNLCCGDYGEPIIGDDRVLMEIKMPEACPLWLCRALSEVEAAPVSFSKYGTCYRNFILPGCRYDLKEAQLSA